MNEDIVLKEVKINEARVTLKSDGIIYVVFNKNIELDISLQMLLLNIYKEVADGRSHPFLFEAFEGISVTKEARENAIRIEGEAPGCAYAVIAKTLPYKLIANFYLKVRKPKTPYKVFSKKKDAVEWLKTFVQPVSQQQ